MNSFPLEHFHVVDYIYKVTFILFSQIDKLGFLVFVCFNKRKKGKILLKQPYKYGIKEIEIYKQNVKKMVTSKLFTVFEHKLSLADRLIEIVTREQQSVISTMILVVYNIRLFLEDTIYIYLWNHFK